MSFLTTQPEELAAAAGKLETIGSAMVAQNAAAAAPTTTGVIPAAADEISVLQARCSPRTALSTSRSVLKQLRYTTCL